MENIKSLKAKLIYIVYEHCINNGLIPYIVVRYSESLAPVKTYFVDNFITLNLSTASAINLSIDDEYISFDTRFGGVSHSFYISINDIICVYPREHKNEAITFIISDPAPNVKLNEFIDKNSSKENKLNSSLKIVK